MPSRRWHASQPHSIEFLRPRRNVHAAQPIDCQQVAYSARGYQIRKVSKPTSAKPAVNIDQSPLSKPRSRRSVLMDANIVSHIGASASIRTLARQRVMDCCAGATIGNNKN